LIAANPPTKKATATSSHGEVSLEDIHEMGGGLEG